MSKFKPESQYTRKGVLVLFAATALLAVFFFWYWLSYIFRVSNETFCESVPGSIPWWIPTLAIFIASYMLNVACKMRLRDAGRNKYVPYDGKDPKFHSCLRK